MSYQSDFFADPVTFMTTHVVRCQFIDGSAGISTSRPMVVTIKQIDEARVVGSKTGRVFHLSAACAGIGIAEKRPIFWLGYVDNTATRCMLNNRAPMMFTANMNGCTLGIGSQAGDGGCLVSHANLKNAEGGEAQRAGQEQQLNGIFADQGFRMVQPSSYRLTSANAARFQATNFGINTDGRWTFYTHRWMGLDAEGEGKIRGRHINGGCKQARPVPPIPQG